MKPEKSVGMFIGAVIIGPLFLLTTFDPNYNIINDFINADTKDKITKILGYLIFIVGGYLLWIDSIIGPLEDKIEQLKKILRILHHSYMKFQTHWNHCKKT